MSEVLIASAANVHAPRTVLPQSAAGDAHLAAADLLLEDRGKAAVEQRDQGEGDDDGLHADAGGATARTEACRLQRGLTKERERGEGTTLS